MRRQGLLAAPLLLFAALASAGPPSAAPSASATAKPHASAHAPRVAAASVAPHPAASTKLPAPPKPPTPAKPAPKKPTPSRALGWAPPSYTAMVKKWHAKSDGSAAPVDEHGREKLVLVAINRPERVELAAHADVHAFAPLERERASWILRSGDGLQHPVDGRILDVVYAMQRHFRAPEVRFLSGYRAPRKSGSNHGFGRAIDLVIPGATDEEVAAWARAQGFAGVGIYPVSGFVHVDVRERSYFWVDPSGPGAPNRTTGILGDQAAAIDAKARAEGRIGAPSPAIGRDVDAAIAQRARVVAGSSPASAAPVDDDDLEDDEEAPVAMRTR